MQNGFIESFNGRMGDELLNESLFLDQARQMIAAWLADYNTKRLHFSLGYRTPTVCANHLAQPATPRGYMKASCALRLPRGLQHDQTQNLNLGNNEIARTVLICGNPNLDELTVRLSTGPKIVLGITKQLSGKAPIRTDRLTQEPRAVSALREIGLEAA